MAAKDDEEFLTSPKVEMIGNQETFNLNPLLARLQSPTFFNPVFFLQSTSSFISSGEMGGSPWRH